MHTHLHTCTAILAHTCAQTCTHPPHAQAFAHPIPTHSHICTDARAPQHLHPSPCTSTCTRVRTHTHTHRAEHTPRCRCAPRPSLCPCHAAPSPGIAAAHAAGCEQHRNRSRCLAVLQSAAVGLPQPQACGTGSPGGQRSAGCLRTWVLVRCVCGGVAWLGSPLWVLPTLYRTFWGQSGCHGLRCRRMPPCGPPRWHTYFAPIVLAAHPWEFIGCQCTGPPPPPTTACP